MEFNFDTDKLIILNYCPGSGGIFLRECLALSENVLHPTPLFAETKYKNRWSDDQSVRASLTTMRLTKKNGMHIENDNGFSMYGFDSASTYEEQKNNANELARLLSNQSQYFFTMGNHRNYNNILHFTSARHIFITGCEELLAKRKMSDRKEKWWEKTKIYKDKFPNTVDFNIDAVFDEEKFYDEISRTLLVLGAKSVSAHNLEMLRQQFVQATESTFKRPPMNDDWDGKGRYRGDAFRD